MAVPVRGVQEIKTLSFMLGSGVHGNERHVHLFRMGALELEIARRTRERQAAIRRIKEADARLVEIDALIRKHQEPLGIVRADASAGDEAPARAGNGASKTRRVVRYGG